MLTQPLPFLGYPFSDPWLKRSNFLWVEWKPSLNPKETEHLRDGWDTQTHTPHLSNRRGGPFLVGRSFNNPLRSWDLWLSPSIHQLVQDCVHDAPPAKGVGFPLHSWLNNPGRRITQTAFPLSTEVGDRAETYHPRACLLSTYITLLSPYNCQAKKRKVYGRGVF